MADELKKKYDLEAELIRGSGGAFEVTLDGNLIFSKNDLDRFPDFGEVEAEVGKRLAS